MELFITPSSTPGATGSPEQSNYAAGQIPKPDLLGCLGSCFSPSLNGYAKVTQAVTGLGYLAWLLKEDKEALILRGRISLLSSHCDKLLGNRGLGKRGRSKE